MSSQKRSLTLPALFPPVSSLPSKSMKIVHIITRLIIGGAQENTVLNCEDLIRSFEDDVLLITGPPLGPEGSLMQRIAVPTATAPGVPHVVVPTLHRSIEPWNDWVAYRDIRRILKEFQPEVVHTHSAKAGILGRIAAHSLRVPVVVHGVHGAPFGPYQNLGTRKFYQWCEWYAAKKCDAFISVANAMSDLMVQAKIARREKFHTIYSGMEVEPFLNSATLRDATREKLGIRDAEIVVGKIARLFHLKGHEFVIEAAREIVQKFPNVRFLFVGDGILAEQYKNRVAELGLEKHFLWTGLVEPQEIPAMISAMDVVVHTSLREGLARVLPQALLSGKPVVSFDIDGAREVVLDGITGFLLRPKSVSDLSKAILRLLESPNLRTKMGNEGRKRFKVQFDHNVMTQQTRNLYIDLKRRKEGKIILDESPSKSTKMRTVQVNPENS